MFELTSSDIFEIINLLHFKYLVSKVENYLSFNRSKMNEPTPEPVPPAIE